MQIDTDDIEQYLELMNAYATYRADLRLPEGATPDELSDHLAKDREQRRRRAPLHVLQALITLVGEDAELVGSLCASNEEPRRTTWRALWLTEDNHLAFVEAYRHDNYWIMNEYDKFGTSNDPPDGLAGWIRPVRTVNRLEVSEIDNHGSMDYMDGVTRLWWDFGFTVQFNNGDQLSLPLFAEETATSSEGYEEFYEALRSCMRGQ